MTTIYARRQNMKKRALEAANRSPTDDAEVFWRWISRYLTEDEITECRQVRDAQAFARYCQKTGQGTRWMSKEMVDRLNLDSPGQLLEPGEDKST